MADILFFAVMMVGCALIGASVGKGEGAKGVYSEICASRQETYSMINDQHMCVNAAGDRISPVIPKNPSA